MRAPIRLEREARTARQAGGALLIGAVLTLLGGGILAIDRLPALNDGRGDWLAALVGTGFALVGLVMLLLGFKTALMTRLPETIVEVDRLPVLAGDSFRVTIRQPGPLRLTSLRLNLVAMQITRYEVWRRGRKRIETDRHLIHQHNVVEVADLTIARGDVFAREVEATVPRTVALIDIAGTKTVVWRLEVWGRVRGWVDFGHPFAITTRGVRAIVNDDAERSGI